MDPDINRRKLLGAAAAGAAALAGCSTAVGQVPPPQVPKSKLDEGGWTRQGQEQYTVFEKTYGGVNFTAKAHNRRYTDTELRKSVSEQTLGRVDDTLAVFSASHIDFSADVDDLPVAKQEIMSQVETNAREQFKQSMKEEGLTSVERVGTGTIDIDTGETAELTEYKAAYPAGTLTFDVPGDQTVAIEVGDIAVNGLLAVWKHGDYALVAGGAYPAEDVAKKVQKQLSSAVTVTVDVDLKLTPEQYAQELRGLITATE